MGRSETKKKKKQQQLSTPPQTTTPDFTENDPPVDDVGTLSDVARALAAAATPTSPTAPDAREDEKLAPLNESVEAAHGAGVLDVDDVLPGLSGPDDEDSASSSVAPGRSQMDDVEPLSMSEIMLMVLAMSPADQLTLSARIQAAAPQVPARPAVDGASSRSGADLLGGLHVGRPSAAVVEPVAASEAGASEAPVQSSSGGTPGEIFGAKVDALEA